jgi:hypothetical protein
MHKRLSFIAFVVYVTLDLSNPFVAGAFNFNPDECVEAAQREQHAGLVLDSATRTVPRVRQQPVERPRVVRRALVPDSRNDWRSPAPAAHAVAALPPSPTEDH